MAKKLIVTTMPFEFSPEQISESIEKNSGRLLVRGILQKATEQNQNGRVYSRALLEREAGISRNDKRQTSIGRVRPSRE